MENWLKDKELYQLLLEDAQSGIGIATLDGQVIDGNQVMVDHLGYSLEELKEKKLSDFYVDPDQRRLMVAQLKKQKSIENFHAKLKDRHGNVKLLNLRARLSTINGQDVIVINAIDITEQKQTEAQLKQNEAFLSSLLEAIPNPVFYKDNDGRYLGVNHAFEVFFAVKAGNIVGKTVFDVSPPVLAEVYSSKDNELLEHGGTQVYQSQVKNASGQIRDVIFNKSVFNDAEGNVAGIIGVILDITEWKETEKSLSESEEMFKTIFQSAEDGILLGDAETKQLVMANDMICKMTGYSKEEITRLSVFDLHPQEQLPHVLEQFEKQLKREIRISRSLPIKRKEGSVFYADVNSTPLVIGERTFLLGIFRDITDHLNIEEELRQAKEKAEAANIAKSTFLANMSHEIRTPINSLTAFAKILKDQYSGPLNEAQAEYLDHILESSDRLLSIINDILDISKVEAGKMPLNHAPFDTVKLMERVNRMLSHLVAAKEDISFSTSVGENVPRVLVGDEHRIEQILRNLCSNAAKFTDQGSITATATMQPDGKLRFEVRDTGIGISRKNQEGLFEKFYQVDSSFAKQYEGSGLGLAICKQLVELMDGRISVSSKLGKGCTFSFSIAVENPTEKLVADYTKKALIEACPIPSIKLNILLAEDDEMNRVSTTFFLENGGHTVFHAANGHEVLQELKTHACDLVLMDIQMPFMDGVETSKRIRAYKGKQFDPNIPIIALTAYAMKSEEELFLSVGMNDCITKPYDADQLLRRIAAYVRQQLGEKDSTIHDDTAGSGDAFTNEIKNFLNYTKEDPAFQQEMLELFLKNGRTRMAELEEAISRGNGETIAAMAHKITNLLGPIYVTSTAQLSKTLENTAKRDDIEGCVELFKTLKNEIGKLFSHVQSLT